MRRKSRNCNVSAPATLYLMAGLPACLAGGYLSARHGRRQVTMLAGLPLAFSWILLAVAPSIHIIFLARFISALGKFCAGSVISSLDIMI